MKTMIIIRRKIVRRICISLAMIIIAVGLTPLHAEPIAIVGGTIIDGNGGEPIPNGVIVIDKDIMTCDEDAIPNIKVLGTYVGGEKVF